MTLMSRGVRVATAMLVGLWLCLSWPIAAQVAVPALTGHVMDLTGTLSVEQRATLEQTLTTFEARKGSQLAVLMIPTSAPEAIEPYALRVAEQWKLGRKQVDDGAILVVAKDDRTLRIEVGYGLEGALNDATSKRIISETILPLFKQQDFYGGITAGITQIIRTVDGEPLPDPGKSATGGIQSFQQYLPLVFILALTVGGILRATLGRVPGAMLTGSAVAVAAWLLVGTVSLALIAGVIALLATLFGGGMGGRGQGHGGYYGGAGRGGFGGGGFRGGGGGFGGGGATGRW